MVISRTRIVSDWLFDCISFGQSGEQSPRNESRENEDDEVEIGIDDWVGRIGGSHDDWKCR